MGTMAYSLFWVMQDLYHPPSYSGGTVGNFEISLMAPIEVHTHAYVVRAPKLQPSY